MCMSLESNSACSFSASAGSIVRWKIALPAIAAIVKAFSSCRIAVTTGWLKRLMSSPKMTKRSAGSVGASVGCCDGAAVGTLDGAAVGPSDGLDVGEGDGEAVGVAVGDCVGD